MKFYLKAILHLTAILLSFTALVDSTQAFTFASNKLPHTNKNPFGEKENTFFQDITLTPNAPLTASDVTTIEITNDPTLAWFGGSVAIDQDILVIGAKFANQHQGYAYVYEFDHPSSGAWGQRKQLSRANGQPFDLFGAAVAISENTIVVGAKGVISNTGAVYVFQRNAGGTDYWGLVKELTIATGKQDDYFGQAVDISEDGSFILVGAHGADHYQRAYLFEKDSGGTNNWGLVKTFSPGDYGSETWDSVSVVINDDQVFIGAHGDSLNGTSSGAVFVYQRHQGGTNAWGYVTTLTASDPATGARFGKAIAVDGARAIIGAHLSNSALGAAYIFERNARGVWEETARLSPADREAGDRFGQAVEIQGNMAIVAAFGDDAYKGSAYIFDYKPEEGWVEQPKIVAPDGEAGDQLGVSVASYYGTIVIGAPEAETSRGTVYLYQQPYPFKDSGQILGESGAYGAMALGDVDLDGDLDVLVGNTGGEVWRNDGTGQFQDSEQNLGSSSITDIALGDLNNDGELDAFFTRPNGEGNTVWLNTGNGIFSNTLQALGNATSHAVALGDLDDDGDLDAFVANDSGGNTVWFNNGQAVFTDSGQSLGSARSHAVALGDVDNDGDLDAFIGNWGEADQIWRNDSRGHFTDSGQRLGNDYSRSVNFGDLDNDNDLDVFVGNGGNNKVWFNNGNGIFTESPQTITSVDSCWASALGDLDGDGDLDVFMGNFDDAPNRALFNDGHGNLKDSLQQMGSFDSRGVALGDLDADGDLDAFVSNFGQPNKVWLNQMGVPVKTPWTIMIYLNGDNSLETATEELFQKLEIAVANNPELPIRVLWDQQGQNDTKLYHILPDNDRTQLARYTEGQTMELRGEVDMSSPGVLREFIEQTRRQSPAEHYLLAIVDHGGGWSPKLPNDQRDSVRLFYGGSGLSIDVTNDYHYLATQEMGEIFTTPSLTENPLDIIFYDACLMGMLEEAYEIRQGARYLIASENETWSTFPYDSYLSGIVGRTPEQQAIWMVDTYHNSFEIQQLPHPHTMAVLDLQQVNAVSQTVHNLAIALQNSLPQEKDRIEAAFLATQKFGCCP